MAENLTPIKSNELAKVSALSNTDLITLGIGNDFKTITVGNLKEALGINALNTKKTNTAMIDNAFKYYGEKPAVPTSFSVKWPMSVGWIQIGNAYIVDFVLTVQDNTVFDQDAAKNFFSFGLNLNHIKNTILGGKTPIAFRGMGSWFTKNGTRPTTKDGGEPNGYGLYLWLDPQNGVIKIARYYTATGGNGQWAITNYEPGTSITGRFYMAV